MYAYLCAKHVLASWNAHHETSDWDTCRAAYFSVKELGVGVLMRTSYKKRESQLLSNSNQLCFSQTVPTCILFCIFAIQ